MLFLGPESLDSEKSEELGRTERRPHLGSSRCWLLQQGDDNGDDVDNDDIKWRWSKNVPGRSLPSRLFSTRRSSTSRQLCFLLTSGGHRHIFNYLASFQFESQKSLQVLMTSSSGGLQILAILLRSSKPGDVHQDHWPLYQERHPKKPPSPSCPGVTSHLLEPSSSPPGRWLYAKMQVVQDFPCCPWGNF